jgi:hypothetical protein
LEKQNSRLPLFSIQTFGSILPLPIGMEPLESLLGVVQTTLLVARKPVVTVSVLLAWHMINGKQIKVLTME